MISKFIKEQKRYRLEDLKCILEAEDEVLFRMIKKLKQYGILKTVGISKSQLELSDLLEEDIEVMEDEEKYLYVFSFVGILIIEGRVLKCYPKYIDSTEEPMLELKQILKVLQKYHSKEQKMPIYFLYENGEKNRFFHRLSVMIAFLRDYYENGIYENEEQRIERNGRGEIVWDKTINDVYPILQQNRPIYIELKTQKIVQNEHDFIKRIHEAMLTICSRTLEKAGLLTIFDLTEVEFDTVLADLGEEDYLLYRLECEKAVQFQSRKQNVLAMMETLLSYEMEREDVKNFSMYGTNQFHLVWEHICAKVLHNRLHCSLEELEKEYGFKLSEEYELKKNKTLKTILEKPKWTRYGKEETISAEAKDTFIPDIVTLRRIGKEIDFFIFDAKYYVTKIQPNQIAGQPGIEAVTKQYLYQLAYQKFLKAHSIHRIKNCFLMPVEFDEADGKYMEVKLEMMEILGLESIEVKSISAEKIYKHYLNETEMDLYLL